MNPVFGSTGLLSTGSWHLCEAAVGAVLRGEPIQHVTFDVAGQQLKPCDIRHPAKSGKSCGSDEVLKSRRSRFKRRAGKPKPGVELGVAQLVAACVENELDDSVSPDSGSGVSEHRSVEQLGGGEAESGSDESLKPARADDGEPELELTLGCQWL